MSRILLFTSKTCPNCPSVRKQLKGKSYVEHYIDTVDGQAEAAYYDVLSVPTVLFIDGGEQGRFTGVLPDGWETYV